MEVQWKYWNLNVVAPPDKCQSPWVSQLPILEMLVEPVRLGSAWSNISRGRDLVTCSTWIINIITFISKEPDLKLHGSSLKMATFKRSKVKLGNQTFERFFAFVTWLEINSYLEVQLNRLWSLFNYPWWSGEQDCFFKKMQQQSLALGLHFLRTLRETKMAPENRPSQ